MERQFSVTLSRQELAAASMLLLRGHPVRRLAPWAILGMGLVLGALLALAKHHFHPETTNRALLSIFAKGLAGTMLFLGLQYMMLLSLVARIAQRGLELAGDAKRIDYRIDGSALTMTVDGVTNRIPWRELRRTIEDDNLLLLCPGQTTFCAFPKSQLDAGTLMALKRRGKPD